MRMKKTICLFSSVFLCLFVKAQDNGEVKKNMQATIADKFPGTRTFDLQFLQYLSSGFDNKLFGKDFQEGEIKSHSRFRFGANIPVIRQPKWNLTSSFVYRYDAYDMQNVINKGDAQQPAFNQKHEYHYLSGGISFTYFSTLFKKPFIYNASILVDGSEKDAEWVKGFLGASWIFKRTPSTTMSVGALIFFDPSSPVPMAPTFSLEYKFRNSPWILDFILPQRLLMKRSLFTNGRLSLGTELTGDNFYVYTPTPPVYNFRQMELRTGITYEHNINGVILTFKSGFSSFFESKLTEKGKTASNYILEVNRKSPGYFSIGASYNPFKKKTR